MNAETLKNDVDFGLSQYQLASKYNISQTTVRYWLKKFNLKTRNARFGDGYVPVPKKGSRYSVPRKLTRLKKSYEDVDWERCQMLYSSGMTWRDLIKNGFPHNGLEWAVKNGKLKLRSLSEACKLAWKTGKQSADKFRTPEFRKKQSKFGGIKPGAGRCRKVLYTKQNGEVVYLQGSWEVKVAGFLDEHHIAWERNKVGYKYFFEGKEHLYFPDFFLSQYNLYVEVKGYETSKDRSKWKQFPFKLSIIKKQELQNLEIWKVSAIGI